tara:strand:+ start:1010 stop:1264 length:255 start_codon:yes stop_codon:yes gene_type:complete
MAEKRYIEKSRLVEKVFDNGGSVINCGFPLEELEAIAENGYVNMTIAKRREPSDTGATHYAYKNEYKPKDFNLEDSKQNENDPF